MLEVEKGANFLNNALAVRSSWRSISLILVIALVLGMIFLMVNVLPTRAAGIVDPSIKETLYFNGHPIYYIQSSVTPPTDAQCRIKLKSPCYSPQEIQKAYGVKPILDAGYTGEGQSIVIIDSFGSPTIRKDLKVFDKAFGLPEPPSFKVLAPFGSVPFDVNNSDQAGWAEETTLDVEWAHALAPDAKIVLLTSPVAETEGVQGLPEFLRLEKYAVDNHLGKIISQSWGATEETLFSTAGRKVVKQFNDFYKEAGDEGVSIFASAGDSGASNVDDNNKTYPFPTVIFPASSPYVTAVGGTSLFADTHGNYNHETVWDNKIGATGGGISKLFKEPKYQRDNLSDSANSTLKKHRGIPDISLNADPDTGVLVYLSFLGPKQAGYFLFGGTSAGSPQWSGLIADGNQLAGHALGFLNPTLYALGNDREYGNAFHDVTVGNNTFGGVTGYDATQGWDLSTGWGTPKGEQLLHDLASD